MLRFQTNNSPMMYQRLLYPTIVVLVFVALAYVALVKGIKPIIRNWSTQWKKANFAFCNSQVDGDQDEYTILEGKSIETERLFPNGGGNGKGSNYHNFTQIYAKYFAPIRHKKIKFLEIGLFQGLSAKMWELYFSKAELHFIDNSKDKVLYNSTRSHYHFFDQYNETLMLQFAQTAGPFDVVIDDGGHQSYQVISSFQTLFPFLNRGAIYAVEDFFTGYLEVYGGVGVVQPLGHGLVRVDKEPGDKEGSSVRYFKNLVDDVNYGSTHTGTASNVPKEKMQQELRGKMSIYAERINSIHFYNGMCIVLTK